MSYVLIRMQMLILGKRSYRRNVVKCKVKQQVKISRYLRVGCHGQILKSLYRVTMH